jgi:hypothetical protein
MPLIQKLLFRVHNKDIERAYDLNTSAKMAQYSKQIYGMVNGCRWIL